MRKNPAPPGYDVSRSSRNDKFRGSVSALGIFFDPCPTGDLLGVH